MITQDFRRALAFALQFEGGWANLKEDAGGPTMKGVTQASYNRYLSDKGLPLHSVRTISDAELNDIYLNRYWVPATTGRSWPLNAACFDVAVNHGKDNAVWMLAEAKKRVSADDKDLVRSVALAMCDVRVEFYRDIIRRRPSQIIFWRGWKRRADALRELVKQP